MKVLSMTAGAADMYCGSCLRDNAVARELIRQGHDVTLIPIYTPTKTDEANVSQKGKVLFGGINVYLQQHWPVFRHTPWLVDRILDSSWALKAASKRSIAVNPKFLGEMTVSMLEGRAGALAKEFDKLKTWLRDFDRPDIVVLPNTMVMAMAPVIREVYSGPIAVTIQGDDLFLDGLIEPYRSRSMKLIRDLAAQVDGFIAISSSYADRMSSYFGISRAGIHVVPLGVEHEDFRPQTVRHDRPFTIGYLARIAPEKGLHQLAESYRRFREKSSRPARLEVAGYLAPEFHTYLKSIQEQINAWGLASEFHYHGELDREQKIRFLSNLDAFSVPIVYDDPKGLYVLEAMASGVPVVAPDRGAMHEHIHRFGGGLLVKADDPDAIASAFLELQEDPDHRRHLGQIGRLGIEKYGTLATMAQRTLEVYGAISAALREPVSH